SSASCRIHSASWFTRNWLALSSPRSDSGGLLHRATGCLPPGPRRLPTAAVDVAGLVLAWAEDAAVHRKQRHRDLVFDAEMTSSSCGENASQRGRSGPCPASVTSTA